MSDANTRLTAAPSAALRASLADRYRLERELGQSGMADYDLSPDGRTFVMLASPSEKPGVVVALNWAADVRRQVRSR